MMAALSLIPIDSDLAGAFLRLGEGYGIARVAKVLPVQAAA